MKFNLQQSSFTHDSLVDHIESHFEDESIQSNFWENKFDAKSLVDLLGNSIVIIEETAFLSLEDGLYAVDIEILETPHLDTIQLYEIDNIFEVTDDMMKERINQKRDVIQSLEALSELI